MKYIVYVQSEIPELILMLSGLLIIILVGILNVVLVYIIQMNKRIFEEKKITSDA